MYIIYINYEYLEYYECIAKKGKTELENVAVLQINIS